MRDLGAWPGSLVSLVVIACMGLYNGKLPSVWMRSIRWHTYENHPQPEGAFYLAHEEMVETIEKVLKFAVRDQAPPRAVRPPAAETAAAPTPPPPTLAAAAEDPPTRETWPTPSTTSAASRQRASRGKA